MKPSSVAVVLLTTTIILVSWSISVAHAQTFQRMVLPKQTVELGGGGSSGGVARCLDEWREAPRPLTDGFTYVAPDLGNAEVTTPMGAMSLQSALSAGVIAIEGSGRSDSVTFKNLTADPIKIQVQEHVVITEDSADGVDDLRGFLAATKQDWQREGDFSIPTPTLTQLNLQLRDKGWGLRNAQAKGEWSTLVRSFPELSDVELSDEVKQEILNCVEVAKRAQRVLGSEGPLVVCLFPELLLAKGDTLYRGLAFHPHGTTVILGMGNAGQQILDTAPSDANGWKIVVVGLNSERAGILYQINYDALELGLRAAALDRGKSFLTSASSSQLPPNRIGARFRDDPGTVAFGGGGGIVPPPINTAIPSPPGSGPLPFAFVGPKREGVIIRVRDWLIRAQPRNVQVNVGPSSEVVLGAALMASLLRAKDDEDSEAERAVTWERERQTVKQALDLFLTEKRRKILLDGRFREQVFKVQITDAIRLRNIDTALVGDRPKQ